MKAFEAHAVLTARHRHVPEVSKFHVAHRRPEGTKIRWRRMIPAAKRRSGTLNSRQRWRGRGFG